MPINPDAVGATSDPSENSWDSKDALLYALGVGAGATDPTGFELEFTTENSADTPQQVLPTMAVVLGFGGAGSWSKVGSFNFAMLVHGEQGIQLHKPIPVSGTVTVTSKIVGIYDKGSGAVIASEVYGVEKETGDKLFTNFTSAFVRGEGGFGGERGPKAEPHEAYNREPDHSVTYQTRTDQALLYRLSGDRNPLHSDPKFAAMGGFERPILHGLCTYGFTGRALLHTLCNSDPARFKGMYGRFSKPVLPGDALTVKMWVTGDGEGVFRTENDRGEIVLDQGTVSFA